jgi:DNA processing protein
VVGSGLDVAYPRQNTSLWARVRESGVILSEAPLGCPPDPWRFPARNRLIASLSAVLVVVESHAAGGSMHTVRAAIDRGVPVMAVPGSIRSPASAGTNQLLADGVAPVTGVDDVMVALSLERAGTQAQLPLPPVPAGDPGTVLEALGWEPADLDSLIRRTGLAPPKAAAALSSLEMGGLVTCEGGWWRRR